MASDSERLRRRWIYTGFVCEDCMRLVRGIARADDALDPPALRCTECDPKESGRVPAQKKPTP